MVVKVKTKLIVLYCRELITSSRAEKKFADSEDTFREEALIIDALLGINCNLSSHSAAFKAGRE